MFDWSEASNFEIGATIFMVVLGALGMAIYAKVSYLVRLKEIELRKNGIIEREE